MAPFVTPGALARAVAALGGAQSAGSKVMTADVSPAAAAASATGVTGLAALPAASFEVFVDIDRIMSVIGNALSNAIKVVPGAGMGQVTVSLIVAPASILPNSEPARAPPELQSKWCPGPLKVLGRAGRARRTDMSGRIGDGTQSGVLELSLTPRRHRKPRARSQTLLESLRGSLHGSDARGFGGGDSTVAGGASQLSDWSQLGEGRPRDGMPGAGIGRHKYERKVLVIEVLDNGRGIAEERLSADTLFRPFQQLRMGDGMLSMAAGGLGLSTVRAIVVDQMGGDSASDDAPRPCVWVVEDVAVARRSVARALRAWGFAVAEMEDGRRAMDALHALVRSSAAPEAGTVGSPMVAAATSASSAASLGGAARWPDAVLLDSRMPELDGEGVLRELRELAASLASSGEAAMAARVRAIPVLGATGSTDAVEQGSLLRGGALAILVKPIDPVELALALEREARIVLPPAAQAVLVAHDADQ
ncbi:hypothetical protein FNF27_06293 [Cafeteria roenbergensis]|uniref:histidine kinase n=1 Tax=Cafeteria roenbergensis TaxID=33653 RepID=A0A5A8E1A8_CAFRO|nr:hypothetical protein FNF27_06293 [Cafeteria roenbergensis]